MKNLLILVLVCASFAAWGQSSSLNLNLPSSPQTYAQDRIRAGNFECQNAIGAATNFEFGVVGFLNNDTTSPYNSFTTTILSILQCLLKTKSQTWEYTLR